MMRPMYRAAGWYAGAFALVTGACGLPAMAGAFLLLALVAMACSVAPEELGRTDVPLLDRDQRIAAQLRAMHDAAPVTCPVCAADLIGTFAHFVSLYDGGAWVCRSCATLFEAPRAPERAA